MNATVRPAAPVVMSAGTLPIPTPTDNACCVPPGSSQLLLDRSPGSRKLPDRAPIGSMSPPRILAPPLAGSPRDVLAS